MTGCWAEDVVHPDYDHAEDYRTRAIAVTQIDWGGGD